MKIIAKFVASLLFVVSPHVFAAPFEIELGSQSKQIVASPSQNSKQDVNSEIVWQKKKSKDVNLSVLDDGNTFCLIHVFSNHLFFVQVDTFSTQGFGDCAPADYFKLTPVSVTAQLATKGIRINRVNLSGVYHPTMDLSRVSINQKFENLGLLKFYATGVSKFSFWELIKNPAFVTQYLQGANYMPYSTVEDVYYLWNPGTEICELGDPSGDAYIMTSYTDMFLKTLKVDSLKSLGSVLELPKGWSYRTRVLKRVLAIESISKLGNSTTRIADNYNNLYIKHNHVD